MKAELKRAMEELAEVRGQLERVRTEMSKMGEAAAMMKTMKAKEEEYRGVIERMAERIRGLEEEMQNRLVDSEDVH
jgi:SMC interacting uncharacterized protein involved in chromosome segregation